MAGAMGRGANQYDAPDGSRSGLIPIEYSNAILEEAVEQSMALSTFRRINMPTGVHHLPVLDALPAAGWINGEPDETTGVGGEKPTTSQAWKGLVLTAEELAAIVVIPEAVLEDASLNLWSEVTPRLAESIGKLVDAAVFAGTGKPASWPAAIIPAAVAAGNVVVNATPDQAAYNNAFGEVEDDGFMVDQVYAATSEKANYRSWNAAGIPIYLTDVRDDRRTDSIYGAPILFDRMGGLGTTKAVMGDPSKALLGIRRDIEYKFLDQATIDISAAQDGSQMINLAQQDSIALRVRARFAFAVANPITHLNPNAATRYPFAVVNPA